MMRLKLKMLKLSQNESNETEIIENEYTETSLNETEEDKGSRLIGNVEIANRLLSTFEDAKIYGLQYKNKALYELVRRRANSLGKTVEQFILILKDETGINFEYQDYRYSNQDIADELLKIYQDGVVFNLVLKNKSLHELIRRRAKSAKQNVKDFIESIECEQGVVFKYIVRQQDNEMIANRLKKLFPNGIVSGLYRKSKSLHELIRKRAKEKNQTSIEFIKSLEFQPGVPFQCL